MIDSQTSREFSGRLTNFAFEPESVHRVHFEDRFLRHISTMSFLPGTASLIKEIDKRLMVVLRDGRTLIGYLRSIDQFANLLLQDTIERIHVGGKYGDIPRGIFLVRGENMVLVGEIDEEKEAKCELEEVSVHEILEAQRQEQLAKEEQERAKTKAKLKKGLPVNASDTYLNHDDVFS